MYCSSQYFSFNAKLKLECWIPAFGSKFKPVPGTTVFQLSLSAPTKLVTTPFNFDLLQILPQFFATNSAECCSSKFRQILPCRSFLQMVALLGWVWKFWPSKLPMRLAADFLRGSILERTTWKVSPVVDPLDSSKLVLAQHQGTRKCQQTARPRKLTDVKMEAATSHQLRLSCAPLRLEIMCAHFLTGWPPLISTVSTVH